MKSILLYHNISKTFAPYGSVVTPETFRKHIRFIKKSGGVFKTPEDFFRDSSGILLTFDDVYLDLYRYALPILLEEDIPALFFVVSGYAGHKNLWDVTLGKTFVHLPWDKIRELHRYGFNIGSHSNMHPDYSRIPADNVREDMKISRETISDKIGEDVRYLSYPFGRAGEKVELPGEAGYERAFTSTPVREENRYLTGRWGVYTIDTIYNITLKLGLTNRFREIERIKCMGINWFSNFTGIIRKYF